MDKALIGQNMRDIRHAKNFSLSETAKQMSQLTGDTYQPNALSKWERGETCPSLLQASYLAKIYGCSVEALVQDGSALSEEEKIFEDIKKQYDKTRSALLYSASKWSGDLHTLVEFSSLCMSLPAERCADILDVGISEYKEAKLKGELLSDAPQVDIDFLSSSFRKMEGDPDGHR